MATSSAMSTSNQYVKYTITVTENSTDVSNNSSNVTVSVRFYRTNTGYVTYGTGTVYCKINGVTYSAAVTSSQKITNSGIVLFTKSLNISHNSDGTKTLICSAWITHSVLTSSKQDYSQVLTTLSRKSTVSASDGTLGTAMVLTVNRNNSSFTHTIAYESGSYSGTICTKSSSTSINWTPPLTLATGAPNGDKVYVAFTIETFSGSTSLGTSRTPIWCTIPDTVKPTISFTASDAMGYSSSFGGYVQGASKVQVVITASGIQGSTIKTYKTTLDGREYNTSSFTSELLSGTGTLTINVTVTDSRGRTATASQDITVFEYFSPKITNFVVKRCNSDGTSNSSGDYVGVLFDAAVAPVNSKNSIYFTLYYKKVSDSSYSNIIEVGLPTNQYSTTNELVVFPADTRSSYDLYLEAADSILSLRKNGTAPPASRLFSILQKGLGWAFGKVAEIENALDINFDLYARKTSYFKGTIYDKKDNEVFGVTQEYLLEHVYPVGSYYISHNDTSPAELFGGTWYRVESRFLYGCATSDTIGLTGGSQTVDVSHSHIAPSGYDSTYYYSTNYWGDTVQTVSETGAGYGYKASSNVSTTQVRLSRTADALGEIEVMPPYVNVALWRRTA